MAKELPERPRLAERALPRRHLVDGQVVIALHDLAGGGVICLDERAWRMLACADGTRDIEGIRLAATRAGAEASAEVLEDFLAQLNEVGLIVSGPPEVAGLASSALAWETTEATETAASVVDPPLDPLPGYSFTCDNLGTCCRRYGTIIFSQLEASRARAHLPEHHGCGERQSQMFMPERGVYTDGALTVAMVDGRCAFHELGEGADGGEGGRCLIHAAAGSEAKPFGCSLYPRTFVDDGEVVRVSTSIECACVIRSIGQSGGEPLVPAGATRRSELSPTVYVASLPPDIELGGGRVASRAQLREWSRAVVASLTTTDVPALLWSLATTSDRDGLDAKPTADTLVSPTPLDAAVLHPWLAALADTATELAGWDAQWRSEQDVARRGTVWVARVAAGLGAPGVLEALLRDPAPEPEVERFYLRALVHGHRVVRGVPLADALRDLAVRLLVARAFTSFVTEEERHDLRTEHPLALVEAMMRGHGLCDYVDGLGG